MGLQEKRPCMAVTGAPQLMDPGRDGQPRPEVPRCPPCQKSASLSLRQLGDALQVHLDADSKRRLDFLIRSTVDGNVQIGADPVPTITVTAGITPKCRHGLYTRERERTHPSHYNSLVPPRRQVLKCRTGGPVRRAPEPKASLSASPIRHHSGREPSRLRHRSRATHRMIADARCFVRRCHEIFVRKACRRPTGRHWSMPNRPSITV